MESDSEEEQEKKEEEEINEELLKMGETSESDNNMYNLLDTKNIDFLNKFIIAKNKQSNNSDNNTFFKIKNSFNNYNPFKNFSGSSFLDEKFNKYIKYDETDLSTFEGDLSQYKSEEFATTKRLNIYEDNILITANTYN